MYGDRSIEQGDGRRAQRKSVESAEPVTNVITGESMGCIGNISHTGVMLIGPAQPESNAVYQVILPLPWDDGSTLNLEVGVQGQWFQQAASAKQYWAGYRIVAISDQDNADLLAWLDQPD